MGSLVAYGFLAYLLTRITPAHFPRRAAIALLERPRFAHRVQPDLLGRSFHERRHRRVRGRLSGSHSVSSPTGRKSARMYPEPAWLEAPAGISSPHPSRSPQGRPCSSDKISWSGNFPGDRAPCHNAVIAPTRTLAFTTE